MNKIDILFIICLPLIYFLPKKSEKYKYYYIIPLTIFFLAIGIRIYSKIESHKKSELIKKLNSKIAFLEKKTKNIDSFSDSATKIGDLVFEKNGKIVNITSFDKKVEERLVYAKNIASKDTDKALEIIEELEHSYPNYFPEGGKILKALYLCKKSNYKESIEVLEKMNTKSVSFENKQIYFNLIGFCYAKLSDYENAKKYLRLAIEENTNEKNTSEARKYLEIIQNIRTGVKIEKKGIMFLEQREHIFVYKVSFQARFINADKNKELKLKKIDIILKNEKTNEEKIRTVFLEYSIQKNWYYLTEEASYEIGFFEKIDEFNLIIKGYFENNDTLETNVIEKVKY